MAVDISISVICQHCTSVEVTSNTYKDTVAADVISFQQRQDVPESKQVQHACSRKKAPMSKHIHTYSALQSTHLGVVTPNILVSIEHKLPEQEQLQGNAGKTNHSLNFILFGNPLPVMNTII